MERLVLVHGSVSNGPATWRTQRPVAEHYELVVLNRPGRRRHFAQGAPGFNGLLSDFVDRARAD